MRLKARIDGNQVQIVKALRAIGASVVSLAQVGKGVPDILVGWGGKNILFKIKNPDMPLGAQKLTPDEVKFYASWKGNIYIVTDSNQAVRLVLDHV